MIQENDLIIADRAYATITGIEYCLENGGDFISRIKNRPFNIYNEKQEKILLTDWLKTLDGDAAETIIYFKDSNKNLRPLRICAVPKTEEEIKAEDKKLKKKKAKNK